MKLRDYIIEHKLTDDFLSEVLNGKRALTTDLAVKIESAIGLPQISYFTTDMRGTSNTAEIRANVESVKL